MSDFDSFDPATVDLAELFGMSPEAQALGERAVAKMRTPLAKGDARLHHFVPRWWLRRFASDDQRVVTVTLAEPSHPRPPTSINKVAAIEDFNTIDDDEIGPTVLVERLLAEIDGDAAKAVSRLAAGVLFPPQARDRAAIDLWLAFQFARGVRHRRHNEAITDFAMKSMLSLITDEAKAARYMRDCGIEPTDDNVADLLDQIANLDDVEIIPSQSTAVADMLDHALRLVPVFGMRSLVVIKFDEAGLALPDEPISMYQRPENRRPFHGVGLGTADELYVPLDRSTGLVLHSEPALGDRVVKAPAGHELSDFNQQTCSHAFREIYCHPDDVKGLSGIELPSADQPIASVSGGDWMTAYVDGLNDAPRRRMPERWRPGHA